MARPDGPSEQKPKSSSESLNFKPLTEGLGFHLFADGLPYAPRSTSNPTSGTGTGATAAGRPSFSFPESPGTSASAPARKEPLPRELQNLRDQLRSPSPPSASPGVMPSRSQPTIAPSAALKKPAPAITQRLAELESYGIGYMLKRLFAYIIDFFFTGSLCGAVLSAALLNVDADSVGYISPEALITAGVFLLGCIWAAIAAQEVAFGTTIGKRIFNLHLRGSGTDVFLRAVFFLPSLLFSGLGILMCVIDSRKRCWHDRVTHIQPEPM